MGVYSIKPHFQRLLAPVAHLLIRLRVHPTYINAAGLVISLIGSAAIFFSQQYVWMLVYIPFMAFFRTACNALDGMVARALRTPHKEFGEVLNEFFDRISDAALFLGLTFASFTTTWLGTLTTVAILLTSYLSILSKAAGGSRQYGGLMGKADRMILLGLMAVMILMTRDYVWGDVLLWAVLLGTLITLAQRYMITRKELVA